MAKALKDPGIIRNRLKVRAVVRNSQSVMTHFDGNMKKFSDFLWSFTDGEPLPRRLRKSETIPSSTEISAAMSKALQKMNFTFVGPTICYAFMQAVGMVNDHEVTCWCHAECNKLAAKHKKKSKK